MSLLLFHTSDSSRVYFLGKNKEYILKSRIPEYCLFKEYKTIKFLRNKKFYFTPRAFIKRIKKRPFLVQKYIKDSSSSLNVNDFNRTYLLGKAIAKLHNIKQNQKRNFFINLKDCINFSKKLLENCFFLQDKIRNMGFLEEYKQIYGKYNLFIKTTEKEEIFKENGHYSFIHGELNSQNILFYKKKIFIIDWESSGYGDPAYDIASLFNMPLFPKKVFISFYKKFVKISDNLLRKVFFYQQLIIIKYMCYTLRDIAVRDNSLAYRTIYTIQYKKYFINNLIILENIKKSI